MAPPALGVAARVGTEARCNGLFNDPFAILWRPDTEHVHESHTLLPVRPIPTRPAGADTEIDFMAAWTAFFDEHFGHVYFGSAVSSLRPGLRAWRLLPWTAPWYERPAWVLEFGPATASQHGAQPASGSRRTCSHTFVRTGLKKALQKADLTHRSRACRPKGWRVPAGVRSVARAYRCARRPGSWLAARPRECETPARDMRRMGSRLCWSKLRYQMSMTLVCRVAHRGRRVAGVGTWLTCRRQRRSSRWLAAAAASPAAKTSTRQNPEPAHTS